MRLRHVPDFAVPMESSPRVLSVRFGDGYEQRVGDGINTTLERMSARFAGRSKAVADELLAFFRAHGGTTPFEMALPDRAWAAQDSGFAVGNGVRTQFPLLRQGMASRVDDWRGEWPAYTKPRTNFCRATEDFTSSAWVKFTGGTGVAPVVTANVGVAPDGTMTADLVVFDKGAGTTLTDNSQLSTSHPLGTMPPGTQWTVSIWMRTADGTTRNVRLEARSATGVTVTVTPVWQRFSVTFTQVSADDGGLMNIRLRGAMSPTNADQASVFLWGAQAEKGATATRYIPNPATGAATFATESPAYDAANGFSPALGWTARPTLYLDGDWQGRRRLYEEPRTNLFQRSDDLTQAVWTKTNLTVTANAVTAPDGTMTADKVVESVSTGLHYFIQTYASAAPNQLHTWSTFVKAAERTKVYMEFKSRAGSLHSAIFDATAGNFSGVNAALTCSATAFPNGWWRISATMNVLSGATAVACTLMTCDVVGPSTTGDGVSGFYSWGSQLEAGPAATPYIPTAGAPITVTDYTLTPSGIVTLAAPPAAGTWLSFDGAGDDVRRVVARRWSHAPLAANAYDVSAEVEEVAA